MTDHAQPDPHSAETAPKTTKVFIKDLMEKEVYSTFFLVKDKNLLTGKTGKSYISMFLSDRTGTIDARIWDNVDVLSQLFQSGDVVKAKGQVQLFQNRKQFVIHRIERALPGEFEMPDFISTANQSADAMMAQVLQIAAEIKHANLRQLMLDTLNDSEIRTRLLLAPAAKTIHHAYYGGLLEHIISICGLMKFIAGHYQNLNLDYLLFGAIFHDIGKIWELDIESGITYTEKGKLLGHMVMAIELIEKKASKILGFPEGLKDLCKHIVLSHHGRVEYGSPKTPVFLEAYIVAAIDDLDSKINTLQMFINSERETGERWSKFNPMFERYFLLKT